LRLTDGARGVDVIALLRDEFDAPIPALVISGDTGSAASRRVRDAGLALWRSRLWRPRSHPLP
jgi:hypothetical protein